MFKSVWIILLVILVALLPGCGSDSKEDETTATTELVETTEATEATQVEASTEETTEAEGYFAGALIEQAGLKGVCVGAAQVSELHAGFLINLGGATAMDFLKLKRHVQETVHARSGIWLESEVRVVGEAAT